MRTLPFLVFVAAVLLAGHVTGDPDAIDLVTRFAPLSPSHPLGTDHLGRDLAARLVAGAGTGLAVVALTTAFGLVAGVVLGTAMRLVPSRLGAALRRLCDLALAVPTLVAALALSALFGATPTVIALALALTGAAATAHVADTLIAAATVQPHVRAARALGATPAHILRRHLLPEVAPALLLLQGYHAARVLLSWSALTFLGLGGDTSRPDWGAMVWEYRLFLFDHPHLPLVPAAAIGVLAWTLARIGDPARRALPLGA